MDRLDQDARREVQRLFEAQHGDDPNVNEVVMHYNIWDGDWIQVKVKDIWATEFPQIFDGHNVFVEEAPAIRMPLSQG